VLAFLITLGLTLWAFNAANSNSDPGWNSEQDFYLQVNAGSVDRTQYAEHPDTNFTNGQANGTWEGWVYPTSHTLGRQAIFSKEDNAIMGLDYGRLWTAFNFGGVWRDNVSSVKPPLNRWSHVAFVKTGQQIQIYLNGDLVVTWATAAFSTTDTDTYPFTIGRRTNGEYFTGRIDEVKIWSTARTQGQIETGMHTRIAYDTSGLQGYWDFNEGGSGTTVYDRSAGYNRDLTLVSSPFRYDVKQVQSNNGDTIITFPRTYLPGVGGWRTPSNVRNMQALAVAGGGGGGGTHAGGGGAGELAIFTTVQETGVLPVKIGQGGTGFLTVGVGTCTPKTAFKGENTVFGTVTLNGGGVGMNGCNSEVSGGSGGSGGGSSYQANSGGASVKNSNTSNITFYGNAGGVGFYNTGTDQWIGGGGGGATGSGGNGGSGSAGGGGSGFASTISGAAICYAAGGAGGAGSAGPATAGGGGGCPGLTSTGGSGSVGSAIAVDGASGSGSGGGGGGYLDGGSETTGAAGSGGSGAVIVRYRSANIDNAWLDPAESSTGLKYDGYLIPSSANGSFAIQMWVNPLVTSTDTYQALWSQSTWQSPDSRYALYRLTDGRVLFDMGAADTFLNARIPGGTWTNVAFVVNNANVQIYINGELTDQVNSYGNGTRNAPGGTFAIGSCVSDAGGNNFNGWIDEVKILSGGVPSQSSIRTMMHSYGGAGLTAYYDFNEFMDGIVIDRTGNGNNLAPWAANSWLSSQVTSSAIVEMGTAYGTQNTARFLRTYITADGGWTTPSGVTRYKALVVAGGGGGGGGPTGDHNNGGGGGAGGLRATESMQLSAASPIQVTVGHGGIGALLDSRNNAIAISPTTGGNSTLGNITSTGGGAGGHMTQIGTIIAATSGGSGGGGAAQAGSAYPVAGAAGTAGQGNAGGNGYDWDGVFQGSGGGGGAGAPGQAANRSSLRSGDGGAGLANAITGTSLTYAGGGGGGNRGSGTAGSAGNGGGGAGGFATAGAHGTAALGGGGGGGNRLGGSGGSGVVILSWGSTLDVARVPVGARPGAEFTNALQIQLTGSDGNRLLTSGNVSLTASAGVLQLNGSNVTQSITVTAVNGLATFTGLGFTSTVTSAQTLTLTADGFVGTSLSITPSYFPGNVNIANGVATQGSFIDGQFFTSTTSGTVNILASDLMRHMASFSTVISASGNVSISADVTTSATASLTVRAFGNISLSSNVDLVLNGGNLILWSDSDNNGAGFFRSEPGVVLNTVGGSTTALTGGGHIYIAGGLDTNSDGLPDGSARSVASTNNGDAVWIGFETSANAFSAYSGGGDIVIRGDSSRRIGVNINGQTTMKAGNGRLIIAANSNSVTNAEGNNTHALEVLANPGYPTLYESHSSHSQAISMVGTSTATTSDTFGVSFLRGTDASNTVISSKGTGGVYIAGSSSQTDVQPVRFDKVTIHAVTSSIVIEARGTGTTNDKSILHFLDTSSIIGASSGLTSSANIILRADEYSGWLGTLSLSTSGKVTIEPYNNSPSNTFILLPLFSPSAAVTGLTIGKPGTISGSAVVSQSSQAISIERAVSINGPIGLYGYSIDAKENITSTAVDANITLRASAHIHVTSSKQVRTAGGDIVLWSDSDNNSAGFVRLIGGATLCSTAGTCGTATTGGGDIVIGGGLASTTDSTRPAGFAAGSGTGYNAIGTSDTTGVQLGSLQNINSGAKVYSAGGNISILGRMYSSLGGSWGAGIALVSGTEVLSGNGKIFIAGETTGAGGTFADGPIEFNAWGQGSTTIRSLSTASDSIWIEGRQSGSAPGDGVWGGNAGTTIDSRGGFTLRADQINEGLDLNLSVSGQVAIEPYGTSFRNTDTGTVFAPKFGGSGDIKFNVAPTSLRVGSASNSNEIEFSGSSSFSFPVEFIGNEIDIKAGVKLINSVFGADIVLKSKRWIDINDGTSTNFAAITTNNGDIVIWTNAYDGGAGYFLLGIYDELNSANGATSKTGTGGGRVTIGGGSAVDADGHPTGPVPGVNVSGRQYALWLEDNSKIYSADRHW
jgi:hypothetical protein